MSIMGYGERFKEFVSECKRVIRVTKKPTKEEYLTISKVAGIGILIIGFLGFALHLINELVSILVVLIVVAVAILLLLFLGRSSAA
jgi:protein transport protein SEC61 subunit gamma-like protein